MGRILLTTLGILATSSLAWADEPKPGSGEQPNAAKTPSALGNTSRINADLKTDKQKASYTIGYALGEDFRRKVGADAVDSAALLLGLQEALAGKKASLTAKQRDDALQSFRNEIQQRQMKRNVEAAEANRKKGEAFLAENKKKPGVVTLPDGLQYLILKKGNGKIPKATDRVEVHYTGKLVDGTVFSSSVSQGEPLSLPNLGGVIKGWREVLQLMKEGDKWRVFIPAESAYGAEGKGPIGPNETLIFEIELLKVK